MKAKKKKKKKQTVKEWAKKYNPPKYKGSYL